MKFSYLIVPAVLFTAAAGVVRAETAQFHLVIKDHRFSPTNLEIPANQKVKLVIENQDATPEEFESHDLNREKIIPGKSKAVVYVGPLKPGTYKFFGEFNPKTANGTLTVK